MEPRRSQRGAPKHTFRTGRVLRLADAYLVIFEMSAVAGPQLDQCGAFMPEEGALSVVDGWRFSDDEMIGTEGLS